MPPIIMLLVAVTFQQAASGPNRPGSPGDSKSSTADGEPGKAQHLASIWRRTLSMGAATTGQARA